MRIKFFFKTKVWKIEETDEKNLKSTNLRSSTRSQWKLTHTHTHTHTHTDTWSYHRQTAKNQVYKKILKAGRDKIQITERMNIQMGNG